MASVADPWKHDTLASALSAPEARSLDPQQAIRDLVGGSDEAAAYLMGRFHTQVMVRGARCRECHEALESMTTTGPLKTSRDRVFPFRATLKQVRRGGRHGCGGRLDFDISLLRQNAAGQINEGGPVVRFRPDMEAPDGA